MKMKLSEIARRIGGEVQGDPDTEISGVAPFDQAAEGHLTLAAAPKFLKRIHDCRAGAAIVPRGFTTASLATLAAINPAVAFAKAIALFFPPPEIPDDISPGAFIGTGVRMGSPVSIGPSAVIGDRVSIGDRVRIHAGAVIEADAVIGDDVEIHPNVTIRYRCRIGSRVIIHAGTVIGGDGFGFSPDGKRYHKIPHTGIVQIDDDVEIGALNAIDRATFGQTWIQRGVKTDNLVHVAHNVTVGEDTLLVAQVGIAGSVTIGRHAILAGQAGVAGHLTIGDNAVVGPQAGVGRPVPEGEVVSGSPEMPHKLWLRVQRIIPGLPELKKKISELEKRIAKVEENG
ncbi:UDP-3-O-(3-hydroxymyristoyl)glucosamine N-acyltransferase [Desulfococcus sp.]|uniref:UDP-3-O-(3-hydroxymyristoyl)glucosamine N-acyltransferase n=1 Tax=Desulfococcus sp. TaxID=2025834 RepID=UPI003593ADED